MIDKILCRYIFNITLLRYSYTNRYKIGWNMKLKCIKAIGKYEEKEKQNIKLSSQPRNNFSFSVILMWTLFISTAAEL